MKIKRDLENRKIYLIGNGKILLETMRIGSEFVLCLNTNQPIIITKETDEYLYMNLKQLLENKYVFYNRGFSYQGDNKIVWFSDQYCDMEDLEETNKVNRLIMEELDEQIKISFLNPYYNNHGIKRPYNMIAFSPCGNGFYNKNLNTGLTFQDDMVQAFNRILRCEIEIPKKKTKTRRV